MKATPSAIRHGFGHLPDGTFIEAVTLANARGMSATILAWGATLQAMQVPGREGEPADVTLGFSDMAGYLAHDAYFGASIGRVANRIAGGRFSLDGAEYTVPANNGPNALHGGPIGFDKAVWTIEAVAASPAPMVRLAHVSPDGDQGFPGELRVTATYTLTEAGELAIDYAASTDRPTIVNLTNHAYWNLAGEDAPESAMTHELAIPAETFLPTDATAIPTGAFAPVAGTPFDFREPTPIGARVGTLSDPQIAVAGGYDHNWVVARERSAGPRLLARLYDPGSGRSLEVLSTEPGVQFYSGNFLDGSFTGKGGKAYRKGDGVALEPQMFPDGVNRPDFGSIRLAPGETYRHRMIFRFGAEG